MRMQSQSAWLHSLPVARVGLLFLGELTAMSTGASRPPETAWGLTRTRALKSHRDSSALAAWLPRSPPCLLVLHGLCPWVPQLVCSPHPRRMEPGSEASGRKGG